MIRVMQKILGFLEIKKKMANKLMASKPVDGEIMLKIVIETRR